MKFIKKKWERFKNLPVICTLFNGTFSATGSFLSLIFVVTVIGFMCFSVSSIKLGENSLEASAMMVQPLEVPYDDIEEIRLIDYNAHVMGQRVSGFQSVFAISGSYTNDEYGIYDVFFSKRNKENYIMIRYSEYDAYLLFNLKDPVQTAQMYNELLELAADPDNN